MRCPAGPDTVTVTDPAGREGSGVVNAASILAPAATAGKVRVPYFVTTLTSAAVEDVLVTVTVRVVFVPAIAAFADTSAPSVGAGSTTVISGRVTEWSPSRALIVAVPAAPAVAVGAIALEILLRREEIRPSGRESSVSHLAVLPLGFHCDLADGAGLPELFIAFRLGKREITTRQCIVYLRFRSLYRCFCPADRRIERCDASIKVHRVHFRQNLTGLYPIAHINMYLGNATCEGRADLVREASFNCADAEERGRD